ncbi:MAG: anthranilate phosphoribosyltransferase, partial [Thiovulaceae bacterium]|nr:anthranilate phosphoribosyltransferase [Sulfurimonadaceae bacterium]
MNYDEAKEKFISLFNHDMNDTQMREFLISMTLDEHTPVESIAAAAEVMRTYALPLPISDELRKKSIDIVGTGGDKIGSFNISSTVSILAA